MKGVFGARAAGRGIQGKTILLAGASALCWAGVAQAQETPQGEPAVSQVEERDTRTVLLVRGDAGVGLASGRDGQPVKTGRGHLEELALVELVRLTEVGVLDVVLDRPEDLIESCGIGSGE